MVYYLIDSFIIQHWQHLSQEIVKTDSTQGIVLRIFPHYLFNLTLIFELLQQYPISKLSS